MKPNLILTMASVLLLAVQSNAQEQGSVNLSTDNKTSVNFSQNVQIATTKNGKSTTVVYGTNSSVQDEQDDTPMKAKTFSKSFLVKGSANTEITSATPTAHASNRSSTLVTEEFVAARAASFAMSVGTG